LFKIKWYNPIWKLKINRSRRQ